MSTTLEPQRKRATLTIFKPKSFTTDELLAWNKGHQELRDLQFSPRSMDRYSAIRQRIESLTWQLIERFKADEANCTTHTAQLEYLTEWFYGSAVYKRLPEWAHRELDGVLSVLRKQQDRKQVWTHVLDGVRVESGSACLQGRYQEIKSNESAHCWRKADGTFVRFN